MIRAYGWVLALAAIELLELTSCLAVDQNEKPAMGVSDESLYQICRDDHLNNLVTVPTGILLSSDSDRGCFLLKTSASFWAQAWSRITGRSA